MSDPWHPQTHPPPPPQIIRERCPCHLYFDLEYVPALNPGADGNALVRLLVDEVAEALKVRSSFNRLAGWAWSVCPSVVCQVGLVGSEGEVNHLACSRSTHL